MKSIANKTRVFRSGFAYTISNFVIKGIGFITTPIFTRILTQEQFGSFNNFTTWSGILLILTSLNLESTMIKARFDYKENFDDYSFSQICLSLLSSFAWSTVIIFNIDYVEKVLLLDRFEIYAMLFYIMFMPCITIFVTQMRFEYNFRGAIAINMITAIGSTILSIVLLTFIPNSLHARIYGYVSVPVIFGVITYLRYIKERCSIDFDSWKYSLHIALPFIPHLLSMYLLGSIDRVIIKQICGSKELALYSLAYTVATLISVLVNSINNAYTPWLGEMLYKNKIREINKVSIPYVSLFGAVSIILTLLSPEILYILGGEEYKAAIFVMPPVLMGCFCQFIYSMYVSIEQFSGKTKGMAIASFLAALFNVFTNYLLVPKYGYIAAAYTTFGSYLLLLIIHIILVKRIGYQSVYNTKTILAIGACICTAILLIGTIYNNRILRLFILVNIISMIFIMIKIYIRKLGETS